MLTLLQRLPRSVTTSVLLAESRVKLYRELRDQSQFAHQIKTDVIMNYEGVKLFVAEGFESKRLRDAMWRYQRGASPFPLSTGCTSSRSCADELPS